MKLKELTLPELKNKLKAAEGRAGVPTSYTDDLKGYIKDQEKAAAKREKQPAPELLPGVILNARRRPEWLVAWRRYADAKMRHKAAQDTMRLADLQTLSITNPERIAAMRREIEESKAAQDAAHAALEPAAKASWEAVEREAGEVVREKMKRYAGLLKATCEAYTELAAIVEESHIPTKPDVRTYNPTFTAGFLIESDLDLRFGRAHVLLEALKSEGYLK